MHQIKWLIPHRKEEEALKILIRMKDRLRWHLEGDVSHVLLIVHQREAAVQAQVPILS